MDKDKQLVCFIDLLGTKESSKISEGEYFEAILQFHSTLEKSRKKLSDGYQIKCFSDCAFMALNYDLKSIQFLDFIRDTLFANGYYFKCSVIEACLDAKETKDGDSFSSTTFGHKTVDAYMTHESFKGIGYIVDNKIAKNNTLKALFVETAFIVDERKLKFKKYWDIKYNSKYTGNEHFYRKKDNNKLVKGNINFTSELNLNKYFRSFLIAKTKNNKYAKYYLSTVISIINSSDFSNILYTEDGKWDGVPIIFYKIFIDKTFPKKIAVFPGSETIFYAAMNKFYIDTKYENDTDSKKENDRVKDKLAEFLSKNRKILNSISKIPSNLLKPSYQNDLLNRIANIELQDQA